MQQSIRGFAGAQNAGYEERNEYIEAQFKQMRDLILSKVPEFQGFVKDVTPEDVLHLADLSEYFEAYLNFLQNQYFDKEICDMLNPAYPPDLLNKQVLSLQEGIVVTSPVPNPIRLLRALYDYYPASNRMVPLRTTAATLLTLWNTYMKNFKE